MLITRLKIEILKKSLTRLAQIMFLPTSLKISKFTLILKLTAHTIEISERKFALLFVCKTEITNVWVASS